MKRLLFLIISIVICTSVSYAESKAQPDSIGTDEIAKHDLEKEFSSNRAARSIIETFFKRDSMTVDELKDSINAIIRSISLDDTVYSAQNNESKTDSEYDKLYDEQSNDTNEKEIAIIAITTPFIAIVIIVIACLVISYKKRKAKYYVIEQAIENNYQIPEYLINEATIPSAPKQNSSTKSTLFNNGDLAELRNSLILIGVGLVLWISFGVSSFVGQMCLIPTFIGIARFLVLYLANKGRKDEDQQQQDNAPQPPELPGNRQTESNHNVEK